MLVDPSTVPPATGQRPWYESLIEQIGPVAASIYAQRELARLNRERARAGQPLITAEEFTRTYQPPVARVEIAPQIGPLLPLLAVGGIVLFLMMRRR